MDKTSRGVSSYRSGHTAKVMPILSSVLVLIGFFLISCVGINLGDIPRGLRHSRDVPSVDPSTLSRKTLYALASLKYCYIAQAALLIAARAVLFVI